MVQLENNPNLEQLSWQEGANLLKVTNPKLYQLLQDWQPGPEYQFIKARYRFGDRLLQEGVFQLPDAKGNLYSLDSKGVAPYLRQQLDYRNIPMIALLSGSNEVFLEIDQRVISVAMFQPGDMLGLWEFLDEPISYYPRRIWSMTAGARSIFMLPKITEAGAHDRLCKLISKRIPVPKSMLAHHQVFIEISQQLNSGWSQEVLIFTKAWSEPQHADLGWLRFHHHLLTIAWQQSEYNRYKVAFDRVWEMYTKQLEIDGIKPSVYLVDTLKQLVAILIAAAPGFRPSYGDECTGPVTLIQDAYIEHYGLKHYYPTIMCPDYFQLDKPEPIYYSLQMPSCLGSLPKTKLKVSYMDELRVLKDLAAYFSRQVKSGYLRIEGTPLETIINNMKLDYFHSDKDNYSDIKNSQIMPTEDDRLVSFKHDYGDRRFASNGTFVRGCVRMMHEK